MDSRSLTRLKEPIVPRASITSNIKLVNSTTSMTPKASSMAFQNSPFARGAEKSIGFDSHKQRFYDQIHGNKPPMSGRRDKDRKMVSSFNVRDDNEEYEVDRFKAPKKSQIRLKHNKLHYKRLRPNPKKKYFYATYIQHCWDARKKRSFGCNS